MKTEAENLWQTREFARRANVTVRTLHYYDRINLLKPTRFDQNGFRLYGTNEFARLQQIATLKFIGFSLKQIKEILSGRDFECGVYTCEDGGEMERGGVRLHLALEEI